jgi:hypothetical protein
MDKLISNAPSSAALIPTAARAQALRHTIACLLATPGCPRIVLVSEAINESRADTQAVCAAFDSAWVHVTLLPSPPCSNPSGNRNWLAQHADTDLLLFVDDDIDVGSAFVSSAEQLFRACQADIVVASSADGGSGWLTRRGHYRHRRDGESIAVAFACAYWRKDVFVASGMLDERIVYGYEDADISFRLPDGTRVVQSEHAFVDRGAALVDDRERVHRWRQADSARAFVALRRYGKRREILLFLVVEVLSNALRRRRPWLPRALYRGQWRHAARYLCGGSRPAEWTTTVVSALDPNRAPV